MPRQTSVTPEAQEKFIELLEQARPQVPAAREAGTSISAIKRLWKQPKGQAFRTRCLEANARAESRLVGVVDTAANGGDVKAAQWLLAVKWPARYSQLTHLKKEMVKLLAELEVERERLRQIADAASPPNSRPADHKPTDRPPPPLSG